MQSRVVNLYVHSSRSSRPEDDKPTAMIPIDAVEAVQETGLREDSRYFRKPPEEYERKRQISLIDKGTLWRLEKQFETIPREFVKAQIVLEGDVFLPDLVGSQLVFDGEAELTISMPRKPCFAMDLIATGVRNAMENGQQGALARVTASGRIVVGSRVDVREAVVLAGS